MNLSSPIARGRTAEVYNWDAEHILKLYETWCPANWIEREADVAQKIVEAGIRTPAVKEVVEIDGRRGIVYERVQGRSMLVAMNRQPWKLLAYARMLAELQIQVASLQIPGLRSYREGLEYGIRHAPDLPPALREGALGLLKDLPEEKSVCHGDFHPGNIIVSEQGPVIIDWMTACSGSPWADVARTSLILTAGVKAAGSQINWLFRCLAGVYHRTYLKHYETSAATRTPEEVRRWLPVMAAARLNERIEPERETLLGFVAEGLSR